MAQPVQLTGEVHSWLADFGLVKASGGGAEGADAVDTFFGGVVWHALAQAYTQGWGRGWEMCALLKSLSGFGTISIVSYKVSWRDPVTRFEEETILKKKQ